MNAVVEVSREQAQAPGCFGAASVFSLDSKICRNCVAYQECRRASFQTLERIRGRIDVTAILEAHVKARGKAFERAATVIAKRQEEDAAIKAAKPKKVPKAVITDLPDDQRVLVEAMANKNARALATSLCKDGLMDKILPAIRGGQNPFVGVEGFTHLRVACQMLIEEGGFTKAQLANRLVRDLGMTHGSAESARAVVLAVLNGFTVVNEIMGYFKLRAE